MIGPILSIQNDGTEYMSVSTDLALLDAILEALNEEQQKRISALEDRYGGCGGREKDGNIFKLTHEFLQRKRLS